MTVDALESSVTGSMGMGAVIGIGIGLIVCLCAVALLLVLMLLKDRRRQGQGGEPYLVKGNGAGSPATAAAMQQPAVTADDGDIYDVSPRQSVSERMSAYDFVPSPPRGADEALAGRRSRKFSGSV